MLRQVHTEMAGWGLDKQQILQSSDRTAATHDQKAVCTYMSWLFVLSMGTHLTGTDAHEAYTIHSLVEAVHASS